MSSDKNASSEQLGITKYQLFCVLAASLTSVNFGWNLVVINQPGDVIIQCLDGPRHNILGLPSCMPASDIVWGVAVGCYSIGNLIGAMSCAWFSNKYGRRFVFIYSNIIGLASALLLALSVNIPMFTCARVVAGIAQGASNGTFSTYVAEITTPRARNSLGCVLELAANVGMVLALLCSLGLLKPPLWRVLFSLTGVLCLLSMVCLLFCVESPKWLAIRNRPEEAHAALQKLRKNADISDEYEQLLATIHPDCSKSGTGNDTASVLDVILGRTPDNLYHQLLVSVMGMVFQQTSGICAIAFFSTSLFSSITDSQNSKDIYKPTVAQYLSVGVSVASVFFTLVGMYLSSYLGRRTMMSLSYGFMAIFSITIAVGEIYNINALAISSVFIFFGAFNLGSGPITWAIPAEITPTYASAAVMAITASVGYLGVFTIALVFKPIYSAIHGYTFLIFAVANFIAIVFFFFLLPETKDRAVSDIARVHSVGIHSVLRAKYKVASC